MALGAFVFAVLGASCSVDKADGPRVKICGSSIGAADVVAGVSSWYVDASAKNATLSLPYYGSDPTIAGTWVRLTTNCAAGALFTVSAPAVIQVGDQIHTQDGKFAAVRFTPVGVGRTTVTIEQAGSRSQIVTITVVPAPFAPSEPVPVTPSS